MYSVVVYYISKYVYKIFSLNTVQTNRKIKRKLFPIAKTSFTKPRSLCQLLNTFSSIARSGHNVLLNKSKKCKKCALCEHYSTYKNMIDENNFMTTKENRRIDIKSKLNCKKYGIYSAQRLKCKEIYMGQKMVLI